MASNALQNAKHSLRREVKQKLSLTSIEEKQLQSVYVANKLICHPKYLKSSRVGIYLSLPDEIQTDNILKHIFGNGKSCFIPRYNSNTMVMVKLKNLEERDVLPKTKWNIPQPSEDDFREEAMQTGGLDLIVVPGRAFTPSGNRLGRGKGYYDKYFSRYKEKFNGRLPFTIGLAFAQQIFDDLHFPATETDQKLDEVLFDSRDQYQNIFSQ